MFHQLAACCGPEMLTHEINHYSGYIAQCEKPGHLDLPWAMSGREEGDRPVNLRLSNFTFYIVPHCVTRMPVCTETIATLRLLCSFFSSLSSHSIVPCSTTFHSSLNLWNCSSLPPKWIQLPLMGHKTSIYKQWIYNFPVCTLTCVVNQGRCWRHREQRLYTSDLEIIHKPRE